MTGIATRDRPRRPFLPIALGALALAVAALAFGVVGSPNPNEAEARETRSVLQDRFQFTVGFLQEPAYEGLPNGLYIQVTDLASPTPTPDPDASPTPTPTGTPEPTPDTTTALKAEVQFGNQVQPLNLVQDPNDPTIYRAVFVPTMPGDYLFRITGKLAGQDIKEEFRSGPDTFPAVVAVQGLQFPTQVPVDQSLLDAFDEAKQDSDRARTIGVAGVALGVIGLLAGGLAVVLSRRPPPPGERRGEEARRRGGEKLEPRAESQATRTENREPRTEA